MLVPLSWLRELLPDLNDAKLSSVLTDGGLEVESEHRAGPELPGVITADIRSVTGLGSPANLRLCKVFDGSRTRNVICGANNATKRKTVALALPGTRLPGGAIIATRKVGDILSEGMICSAEELGLAGDPGGILLLDSRPASGMPVEQALDLADTVLNVAVTPNRGDWLSMRGIARETAALAPQKCRLSLARLPAGVDDVHEARIEDGARDACPRFCCLPVSGINPAARTPGWMAERLRRCGVRPVSAVVDITNYVMLEYGQPLHAFDRARLKGAVHVRFARADERLALLDGTVVMLAGTHLCVCDDNGPVALAGVMGGQDTAVTGSTAELLLEAAHFAPAAVRGRTRELNIASEAAFRFERGVDPVLCPHALARAAKLIRRICGGFLGRLTDAGEPPAPPAQIELPDGAVDKLTGMHASTRDCRAVLRKLGFAVKRDSSRKVLLGRAPSWRFDVEQRADLIEEIVRVLGYDSIPASMPDMSGLFRPAPESLVNQFSARRRLVAEGFSEVVTYSFVPPEWEADFYGIANPPRLKNPIAEQASVMRSGLLGCLADRAVHNFNRRAAAMRLFELSRCFPDGGRRQPVQLAALCSGAVLPDHWTGDGREFDFFDMKGVIERLLAGVECEFAPHTGHPALHPGRSATMQLRGVQIGVLGELHPALQEKYGLRNRTAVFELDFEVPAAAARGRTARNYSKLPIVRRDLSLVVSSKVTAADIIKCARISALREIVDVSIFDCYEGTGNLGKGAKSVGLRLVMQGWEDNLVDEQIDRIVAAMTEVLCKRLGATIRSSAV